MAFSDSWILFLAFLAFSMVDSEPPSQDKQALLSFLSGVPHARRLQWNSSDSVCNWVGVGCNENKSDVYYLRLPGIGFVGEIPDSTLGNLIQLRVLSLRSNKLSGSIPSDFSNLKFLRYLYLQENQLSGEFPLSVSELTELTRLDLSNNEFTGSIPVINLSQLTGLFLQNNGFSGPLPSINSSGLTNFNVSNNHLNGTIPTTLVKFSENSFAGNIGLCGGPLPPCNPISPSPSPSTIFSQPPPNQNPPSKKSRSLSRAAIIGISVAAGVLGLILLLLILLICFRRMKKQTNKAQKPTSRGIVTAGTEGEAGASTSKDDVTGGSASDEKNKLIFIKGSVYSFDLEDLLRASAEVLGKGSLGTSYKAVLEEGTTVVVKRLKDVAANKKEFEQQMVLLGKIKHENVLPLRAYYYSRDEKLLVSDYLPSGSLSSMLHGSRGSGRTPLNWENRMKIAVAAVRGLAYLHVSDTVHGNIKSSNVLIGQDNNNATVSDYGLNPVFSNSTPSNHRAAGYRAPEVIETRKVTFKSDVYGYGVLLLELLTGKAPNQTSLGEEGIDLPRWVQSVVREEWTAEVFDVELMRCNNGEEEMVQLLQVGMACVATVPDQRPVMSEVVRMVEDIHRGDEQQPSSDDPSKGSSGQTPPPEISTVTP